MIKLLLFLCFVSAIGQNGIFGKPVHGDFDSVLQVDFSDSADPTIEWQKKRNSYYSAQDSEDPNPTSLCYFVQESETESQIACRLRFIRSKFNFNPFGLRFGKRQGSPVAGDRKLNFRNGGKITEALLKPSLDRRFVQCEDNWEHNC